MKLAKTILMAAVGLGLCASQVSTAQTKAPTKAPAKPSARGAASSAPAQSAAGGVIIRRDPFRPLVDPRRAGDASRPPEPVGPGLHNLPVGAARIDGIVRAPSGMIVVISTPQQRVYFAREGEKLLDGSIERITMDAVIFRQIGKDPFGKTVEQRVTRYLYPKAGEQ
jgi:hypothetical protein